MGEKFAAELTGRYFSKVLYLHHDVVDEESWERTVNKVVSEHGRLDVLVNNAGIEYSGFIENIDFAAYKRQQAVNEDGVFLGCSEAIRVMKHDGISGKGGSRINLSSIAGITGGVGLSAYGGTKGFVRALSKHLAVECGTLGYGIRVNSIFPGLIQTDMATKVFDNMCTMGLATSTEDAKQILKTRRREYGQQEPKVAFIAREGTVANVTMNPPPVKNARTESLLRSVGPSDPTPKVEFPFSKPVASERSR